MNTQLYDVLPNGELVARFHAGQMRAWECVKRVVLVLAGAQGGKTSWGPFWLAREIQLRGPGDYMVVAPTFKLMSLKLFPEFMRLFRTTCRWGDFTGRGGFKSRFLFSPYGCKCLFGRVPDAPTQVHFGHAQDPDSLESATAKGVWLDEAGQRKFRLGSWEAVNRRASIYRARILITTTPYTLGWLRDLVFLPWKRAEGKHPYIDVVNFKSTENPAFPMEEYEERKRVMPGWKFRMFYDGEFERPAGAVYQDFDSEQHVVDDFAVPDGWRRVVGIDFGGVHTAAVFLAEERDAKGVRTGRWIAYREYPEAAQWVTLPVKLHARLLRAGEPKQLRAFGGAKSEVQWREEFRAAGLLVEEPPVSALEVGIDRVAAAVKLGKLLIMRRCRGLVDDVQNYSRVLDDSGEPLDAVEDKEQHHYCDALRYGVSGVTGPGRELWVR